MVELADKVTIDARQWSSDRIARDFNCPIGYRQSQKPRADLC
jgi:hypothetical protein